MAGPQRIELRRRLPRRALSNLGWYGATSALCVACAWLLFRDESSQLDGGAENPLAGVPIVVTVLALAGGLALTVPVLLRPGIAADHHTLLVRTGPGRMLALPWAWITEVAVVTVRNERHLLVRCARQDALAGGGPGWLERAALRRLVRRDPSGGWGRYDLAVPMRDFVGSVAAHLTALAAFAPDTVSFADEKA